MIVDSSALIAIVFKEPGWQVLVENLLSGEPVGIGTSTLAESALVLTARLGANARPVLSRMLQEFAATPVDFGDCMCYATAKLARQPLLFVGQDFTHTDLVAA